MKKSEQNRREKRERILAAAQKAFQRDGFTGANMDRIAKEAAVTKQTVYRYFQSKEALFKAALEARRLGADDDFLAALDQEDPLEALIAFATGFIRWHLSEAHLSNIRLLVSQGPEIPEITRAFYTGGPHRTRSALARFLKERFTLDETGFEISVFINTLLSMRMPMLTGLHGPPSDADLSRHARRSVAMLMKLLDLDPKAGGE